MNRSEIVIIVILFLLTIPLSLVVPEWAGVCLIYSSFAIVFLSKDIRKDWRLLAVIVLIITAHHIASLVNAYYATLMGADLDAVTFHENAKLMAYSIQPSWFAEFGGMDAGSGTYTRFLSIFYRIFGDSRLLGQELSVMAYVCSCLFLIKSAREMGLTRWQIPIVILYGLLPSTIIFTSITMREAYQMLFFLMGSYFTLTLRKKASFYKLLMIVLAGFGFGILHNGLLLYAVFLVCFSFFWGLRFSLRNWKGRGLTARLAGIVLLGGVLAVWLTFANDVGGASKALMLGEGSVYAGGYRDKVSGSYDRATYGGKLDTSSVFAFIPSAVVVFTLYMFAPFPWQISSPVDIYAALEGLLRMLLLYQALATWYRATGERKSQWGYLLICYFSLEFLWAAGTANWGTATRHHVVAYGVLALLGGPGLARSLGKRLPHVRFRARQPIRKRRLVKLGALANNPSVALDNRIASLPDSSIEI